MKKVPLILALLAAPAVGDVCGVASWYSSGTRTASGEKFNPNALTAAHRSLPFGTKLKVTFKNKAVTVKVSDRGPFIKGRILDLSKGAARQLGISGVGHVCMKEV